MARGTPGRERVRQASARLTPAEHDAWIQAATESGHRELGPWIREVGNAAIGRPTPGRPKVPKVNLEAYGELSRLGNNVNQLVYHANKRGTDSRGS